MDQEFTIRAYTKKELALLYFPDSTPATAVKHLMATIRRCDMLWDELQAMGYNNHQKPSHHAKQGPFATGWGPRKAPSSRNNQEQSPPIIAHPPQSSDPHEKTPYLCTRFRNQTNN